MKNILPQLSKTALVACALLPTLVAAAPNQALVTGSTLINSTRAANIRVQGVQGRKSGGGGGFTFLGIGGKGGGGRSSDTLNTEANIGLILVSNNATVSGSKIIQQTEVTNAHVKGATLNAGQVRIGGQ